MPSTIFTHHLSPSTWRLLGLYVGASYISLGAMYILLPTYSATQLGLLPRPNTSTYNPTSTAVPQSPPSRFSPKTKPSSDPVPVSDLDLDQDPTATDTDSDSSPETRRFPTDATMTLLGARDIAVGLAILSFWATKDQIGHGTGGIVAASASASNTGMGKVILSGMVICAVDVAVLNRLGMTGPAIWSVAGGALLWGVTGCGLVGW